MPGSMLWKRAKTERGAGSGLKNPQYLLKLGEGLETADLVLMKLLMIPMNILTDSNAEGTIVQNPIKVAKGIKVPVRVL